MSKLYLFLFSVLFLAVYPMAVEAQTVKVTGQLPEDFCSFGKVWELAFPVPGMSLDTTHRRLDKSWIPVIKRLESVHQGCLSQYDREAEFELECGSCFTEYKGRGASGHYGDNSALGWTRCQHMVLLMQAMGFKKENIKILPPVLGADKRYIKVRPLIPFCKKTDLETAQSALNLNVKGSPEVLGQIGTLKGQDLPDGERITVRLVFAQGGSKFTGGGSLKTFRKPVVCDAIHLSSTARTAPPVDNGKPVPVAKETKCSDGIDNDGDKLIDCADPDCEGSAVCGPEDTDARCKDGVDNDGDGFTDCEDKDCSPFCPEPVIPSRKERNCSDGVDNDKDGKVDCEDSDCDCEKSSLFGDISKRLKIETTIAGMFFVPNQDALGGVSGLKTSDGLNTQVMFNLNIDLGKGFSLVPGVGASSFTRAYEFPNTDEDILTKDVRHWELRAQLVLLKQIAKNLEVGLGFGANFNQADELWFVQGVLRYSLDDHWFVTGGVEVFFFTHPLDGSDVRVWAPILGIGYRW